MVSKREYIELAARTSGVSVILDASHPGVFGIPREHHSNRGLHLDVSEESCRYLEFTDRGWRATMGFGGLPHNVWCAWEAVWAAGHEGGKVVRWPGPKPTAPHPSSPAKLRALQGGNRGPAAKSRAVLRVVH